MAVFQLFYFPTFVVPFLRGYAIIMFSFNFSLHVWECGFRSENSGRHRFGNGFFDGVAYQTDFATLLGRVGTSFQKCVPQCPVGSGACEALDFVAINIISKLLFNTPQTWPLNTTVGFLA